MIATLSLMGRWLLASLRFFTIKDRYGHPRWLWSVALLSLVGAFVAAAFLAGIVFRGTNAFDRLKTRVQIALAGDTLDPVEVWADLSEDELSLRWQPLETNNMTLERVTIPIGQFFGSGGSIFETTPHLGFVTPKGRIGYISHVLDDDTPAVAYIDLNVPMNSGGLEASEIGANPRFNRNWFRTMDSVVRPIGDDAYELYVSHHRYNDAGCFSLLVSRTEITSTYDGLSAEGAEWETFFEGSPCIELKTIGNLYSGLKDGGRMAITDHGTLILTLGDMDFDGDNSFEIAAQDVASDLGKVHEIDLTTGEHRQIAMGMRNPQGLVLTGDGLVFTTDHGPNGGDEVNLVREGGNYGWPHVTLGMAYGFPRRPWPHSPVQGRHDGFERPAYAFVPSIGIGAITEITSDLFEGWQGDLIVVSLENQGLYRLRREGGDIYYSERTEIGERMRDVLELSNGQIALLTDSARIILLRPRAPLDVEIAANPEMRVVGFETVRRETADAAIANRPLNIHPGRMVFESRCSTCHALDTDEVVVGPSLNHIAGRRVGSVAGYPYSDALSGRSERWTEERIRLYLSDPDAEFRGSNMPRVALTFPEYLHIAWWLTNCTGGRDRPECHTDG